MESCTVSFSTLLMRGEMRTIAGMFDERLDGGEWCLAEYVRRAASKGYRACITADSRLACDVEQVFGSAERRQEMILTSRASYLAAWGVSRHYVVYFGKEAEAAGLNDAIEIILEGARQRHRFTLLLHRRQYSDFRRKGWNGLHTGIELYCVSLLFPKRDLQRKLMQLQAGSPDLLTVRGSDGVPFPLIETAIPMRELIAAIAASSNCLTMQPREVSA
jgi:hypothetical protein